MIAKVKARRTTIGDRVFRYKVSSRPISKGVYEMNITIQSEEANASKLVVHGIFKHDFRVNPRTCFDDVKFSPTVIRGDTDGFLNEAIDLGWDYTSRGNDFMLNVSNELFRLFPYWEDRPKEWYHGRNYTVKQKPQDNNAAHSDT